MYTIGFLVFLVLTLIAVVLTLISGRRKARGPHLVRALSTVVLLITAVVFAFLMATERTFPAYEMGIHRYFSMSVACIVPLLVLSGILLWNKPGARRLHQVCIVAFLVAAAGAFGTGIWILSLSTVIEVGAIAVDEDRGRVDPGVRIK